MVSKKQSGIILILILFAITGCKNWHVLSIETDYQPVQLGPHLSSMSVDTLGIVSWYYSRETEEDTYAESEHFAVTFEGGEYYDSNLNSTVFAALEDDPDHFIADGYMIVEVSYGITFGSFIKGWIASALTGAESSTGSTSKESITQYGIVYKPVTEVPNE